MTMEASAWPQPANNVSPVVREVQKLQRKYLSGKRESTFAFSDGATEIISNFLWLGNADDAAEEDEDDEWMDGTGITHILNCA